jgi:hypothetical protein
MNNKIKITINKIEDWVSEEMFGYSFTLPQFEVYAEHEGKNYFQTFIGFDKLEAKNKMKSLILSNKINPKDE